MASDAVVHVSDSDFEKVVLQADKPALIDFWAPWCGPCKALGPILDALAADYVGRAVVAKMNIDDNTDIPARYDVRSIPTLILFKDGAIVDTLVGLVPRERLEDLLKKAL